MMGSSESGQVGQQLANSSEIEENEQKVETSATKNGIGTRQFKLLLELIQNFKALGLLKRLDPMQLRSTYAVDLSEGALHLRRDFGKVHCKEIIAINFQHRNFIYGVQI
ncbi:hypothetical protein OGAPHI_006201 [Ogataea philodendri]|uniref:Uncharacterized protein n=1 Tax=Ogataea philodendri TaxID=1378263 RepID=A0A9P8NYU5_9ASCO|nr:uncharacterized protein OGAPHI_006201 [Ogataea philodendri]KAH3662020.1 hypothetical protein OGAPHI_006201 [Ogataea philodendri]